MHSSPLSSAAALLALSAQALVRFVPRVLFACPHSLSLVPFCLLAMQLTASERGILTEKYGKGWTPQEIRDHLGKRRKRLSSPQEPPDVCTIQRFVRRRTHNRVKETRGRKAVITKKKFATLNAVRKKLIKKAKGGAEVTLHDVKKKAKVNGASPVSFRKVSKPIRTLGLNSGHGTSWKMGFEIIGALWSPRHIRWD